jgi:hypothetical protein
MEQISSSKSPPEQVEQAALLAAVPLHVLTCMQATAASQAVDEELAILAS